MTELIDAIEKALKDHGVDWILRDRYSRDIDPHPFRDLTDDIKIAIKKYKVVYR